MKKLLSIILSAVAALCLCLGLAACADGTEETKYDVAIRVACSDGEIYEFPTDTTEKSATVQYTGTEREYRVVKYQLVGFSDEWIDQNYSPYSPQNFSVSILKGNESTGYEEVDAVKDAGSYCVLIESDYSSDIMNFRVCRLYIEVTN